jgi:succinate dehydrogenase / fumarate reductase flavoprotein subunit
MRIYPATHYTMGGLWVDYNLQTTMPGLFAIGEANFSDHGANRLGASALMQGLADGYFVLPPTMAGYLAPQLGKSPMSTTDAAAFEAGRGRRARPHRPADGDQRHALGRPLPPRARQDHLGLLRHGPQQGGSREGPIGDPGAARGVPQGRQGARHGRGVNQSLEKALRVADFMELAELKVRDALHREESCGGHFREEHQTPRAKRSATTRTSCTSAPGSTAARHPADAVLHKEPLVFEAVKPTQRSYKYRELTMSTNMLNLTRC